MKKIAALLAIPALAVTANAVIIIDDFNNSPFDITATGVESQSVVQTGVTGVLGGVREARAHNISGTSTNRVTNSEVSGQFTWSVGTGTTGHFHLYYGTYVNDGAGAQLNADFTGENGIALNVLSSDFGGSIRISLSVNNGASTWSELQNVPNFVSFTGAGGPAAPYYVYFAFSNFTQDSGTPTTLDTSDIDGITFEAADDYASRDWAFDAVISVPEPSTTMLLGLSGVTFLLRRRRA